MISKNTNNISFKNFQYKLQDDDVRNCFFMNETFDKYLVDIDVYQKLDELRNKQTERGLFIDRVRRECENNIWYYFREVVRIPDLYHISTVDDTGLARYPLTNSMAKVIYLYDNGFSPVVITDNSADDITRMTLVYIALWEEYFLQRGDDNTSYVNFFDNETASELFKDDMLKGLWSMNSIIGNIDGLSPHKNSISPWNYKIFTKPKIKDNRARNVLISPIIKNDEELKKFLKDVEKRFTSNCIGKIVTSNDLKSFYILDNYVLSSRFCLKDDYSLYDCDLSSDVDAYKLYKIY